MKTGNSALVLSKLTHRLPPIRHDLPGEYFCGHLSPCGDRRDQLRQFCGFVSPERRVGIHEQPFRRDGANGGEEALPRLHCIKAKRKTEIRKRQEPPHIVGGAVEAMDDHGCLRELPQDRIRFVPCAHDMQNRDSVKFRRHFELSMKPSPLGSHRRPARAAVQPDFPYAAFRMFAKQSFQFIQSRFVFLKHVPGVNSNARIIAACVTRIQNRAPFAASCRRHDSPTKLLPSADNREMQMAVRVLHALLHAVPKPPSALQETWHRFLVGCNINLCVLQGSFEPFHCHAELTYECMLVPHDFEIFSKYLLQSAFLSVTAS